MSKYILVCAVLMLTLHVSGQSDLFGFGFRAGLSYAKIDGPSELGMNGEKLEINKMTSGFHIGMTLNLKVTDIMGLRAELIYSQRGNDYTYEGPSYFVLGPGTLQSATIMGTRKQTINVANSYIDIPLTAYYKIGYFEIFGGLNTGVLIGSSAGGEIAFEGTSPNGNPMAPFEIGLDYNYKKDEAGAGSEATNDVNVDGRIYKVPQFIGAYYEFPTKEKSLYETLDFGLTAGIAYFLNDGLFLSVRYLHGLGDMDSNFYDRSLQSLDSNGNLIPRADVNKSKSWQFSVGFSF